jgi:hypothetical protein
VRLYTIIFLLPKFGRSRIRCIHELMLAWVSVYRCRLDLCLTWQLGRPAGDSGIRCVTWRVMRLHGMRHRRWMKNSVTSWLGARHPLLL